MQTASRDKPFWRSRWWMPAFSLFLGAVMLGAFAIGGDIEDGLFSFGVMASLAALIVLGGRSETIRGLSGQERDERWAMIDIHATALAGIVVIIAIIGAWLWEIAHGGDGSPYGQLGAIGGLAYIAAVAFLPWLS
jgi:hypothetical protein